jgi:phosphoglycolate phosphatase
MRREAAGVCLVAFDLDGTLVDSRTDLANTTNALLQELGGPRLPDHAVAEMVGEGAGVLIRRALSAAGLNRVPPGALERFLELYDARLLDNTRAYDGMHAMLDHLAKVNVRMSVLTNKPARATEAILEGLDLRRYFRDVIGGDSPFGRKPDPAGLRHLIAAADAAPETTLLVGDSRIDLETARAAGCRICLARYGFGYRFAESDFDGAELFIDTPEQLVGLVLNRGN